MSSSPKPGGQKYPGSTMWVPAAPGGCVDLRVPGGQWSGHFASTPILNRGVGRWIDRGVLRGGCVDLGVPGDAPDTAGRASGSSSVRMASVNGPPAPSRVDQQVTIGMATNAV